MYLTKSTAKGGYTLFEPGMHLAVKQRLQLKADLAGALGTDELSLHYQPIIDLATGEIVGVEALARWNHPELGPVSPAEFIPVAEESGLIVPLGLWVLQTACGDVQSWSSSGVASPALRVNVNVSGRQLEHPDFVRSVRRVLDHLAFDPTRLVLEITETVLVSREEESIGRLHQLKALGVQLAIDDFGTGYSSLSSLQALPVDIIKIDRSFISQLQGDGEQANLARAVLGLGRTLRLQTVAEGVECDEQAAELRRLECNLAQGFFFARPTDSATVAGILQEHASLLAVLHGI
jgi:EAL domain-containing protein (putative c-di-GMP-specific phosphodiesterase class I)